MTIYYMSPGSPDTISGGTRKLYDHVAILQQNGFDARIVHSQPEPSHMSPERDMMVIPDVYGEGLRLLAPAGIRRVSLVQNSYLVFGATTTFGPWTQSLPDLATHPYMHCSDLIAVLTESQHTEDRLRAAFPDLPVPMIRTHSSGNGRNGQDAGFFYGEWPREKRVIFFQYKHEAANAELFGTLSLPDGWVTHQLGGTDQEIAEMMRTSAIFVATNQEEGLCAPTQEALLSGCLIVCWPGGPTGQSTTGGPMEYLLGRAVVAVQDDMDDLRRLVEESAQAIEADSMTIAEKTREWSDWHRVAYSREAEVEEICRIFTELGHGPA